MGSSAPAKVYDRVRRRLVLVGRLAETWARRPITPTRAVVQLTRRCNLRCNMCKTWALPAPGELSADEIGDVVGAMTRLAWLDLTGGEPFVRSDIEDVFVAVVERTPALGVLHFQTNGWMRERVLACVEQVRRRRPGLDLIVTVSLDGPPSVHDAIRGRPGSFERALGTANALMEMEGVEVHIGTTVGPDNSDHLDALEGILRARLLAFIPRRWHWNALQVSRHFYGHDDAYSPKPIDRDVSLGLLRRRGIPRGMVELMEALYLLHLEFVQRGEPSGIPCQALRSTLFLSPEGDVYPCHLYDRPLGNVRTTDLATLWHSEAVAEARRDIEALACGGCFSACEAYPAMAGAPLKTARRTAARLFRVAGEVASRS